jgi:hypothetical protein
MNPMPRPLGKPVVSPTAARLHATGDKGVKKGVSSAQRGRETRRGMIEPPAARFWDADEKFSKTRQKHGS